MRETRPAAKVFGIPVTGDIDEAAGMAEAELNAFLAARDLAPEDILAMTSTAIVGTAFVASERGASYDHDRADPGFLVTLIYRDRGRP